MSMEHDSAGATTEELLIEAREARRDRRPGRIERVGDHIKREWQLYLMLIPTILWLLLYLGFQNALSGLVIDLL